MLVDDAVLIMPRLICCFKCRNVVALQDDMIKKDFTARRYGRGCLFSHVWNVTEGPRSDRTLISGVHKVANVYCSSCNEYLGWTYSKAYDSLNKYKEGKTVLIKMKIINKEEDRASHL